MKSIFGAVFYFLLSTPLICLADHVDPPKYDAIEYLPPGNVKQISLLVISLLLVVVISLAVLCIITKIKRRHHLSFNWLDWLVIVVFYFLIMIYSIALVGPSLQKCMTWECAPNPAPYREIRDEYKPCHDGEHNWEVIPDKRYRRCTICHLRYYPEQGPNRSWRDRDRWNGIKDDIMRGEKSMLRDTQ